MSLKALIIDDELHCRENLNMLVQDFCPDVEVIAMAPSAEEAKRILSDSKVDLVFLDIMMPHSDGFDFLASLDQKDFSIVFTTAHSEFALKAIKAGALDYLQKPIDIEELQEAVKKVSQSSPQKQSVTDVESTVRNVLQEMGISAKSSQSEISIPTRDGLEIVKFEEIIRLEGSESYTTIFLNDGRKFLSSKTIKVYEEHLPEADFMRIHRSHVINLSFLKAFRRTGGSAAILSNGDEVPISRRKLQNFLERIQSF